MTRLVAIVNVTPDSFSDGRQSADPADATTNIEKAMKDGADVIDIGAESTRPGATPLSAHEEWQRLEPVLRVASAMKTIISVDTRHAETARRALDLGVHWINDVSGFAEPDMVAAVKGHSCMLVAMHSLGIPASKEKTLPAGSDAVKEIIEWGRETLSRLTSHGIVKERIILDPGIGFGKTAAQSIEIIKRIGEFKAWGQPVLVGHSRKSFLSLFTDKPPANRDEETLSVSEYLALNDIDYLRVHEMPRHRAMLNSLSKVA